MGRDSHYRQSEHKRPVPTCPECGQVAQDTQTKFGVRSACCGLWSWNHYPLVDAATHDARKAAHAAFDTLWKDGHMSRKEAYRRLGLYYGRHPHIKTMSREEAELVPQFTQFILEGLG